MISSLYTRIKALEALQEIKQKVFRCIYWYPPETQEQAITAFQMESGIKVQPTDTKIFVRFIYKPEDIIDEADVSE